MDKETRTCNKGCGNKFIIIKPDIELPESDLYYTCNHCIARRNMEIPSRSNWWIKEYEKFDDIPY